MSNINNLLKLANKFVKYASAVDDLREVVNLLVYEGYGDKEILALTEDILAERRIHSYRGLQTEFSDLEAGQTDPSELFIEEREHTEPSPMTTWIATLNE